MLLPGKKLSMLLVKLKTLNLLEMKNFWSIFFSFCLEQMYVKVLLQLNQLMLQVHWHN